jgi:hypothetical protein
VRCLWVSRSETNSGEGKQEEKEKAEDSLPSPCTTAILRANWCGGTGTPKQRHLSWPLHVDLYTLSACRHHRRFYNMLWLSRRRPF